MIDAFRNIFKIPDLRSRVLFTFAMLAIYRIGAQIPTPGINALALQDFFKQYASGILGFWNIFSGGAFSRCTIFALGIMPYITASIIFSLLVVVWPYLAKLQKEGGVEGRRKINQYTRYATILICIIQSFGISVWVKDLRSPAGVPVVPNPNLWFHISVIIILTAGATFIMWLGEQITARGVGNGISLMIFSGIVVGLIPAIIKTFEQWREGNISLIAIALLLVFMVLVVAFIVYFERAQRRIPVQYAKRIVGNRLMGGQSVYFPLKLNPVGVISIIFAVSLLSLPATILKYPALEKYEIFRIIGEYLNYGTLTYLFLYSILIIIFTYFYMSIVFNPEEIADNLKKFGGFIPGIRPGKSTADYLYKTITKLIFAGCVYLIIVAILPIILMNGLPLHHLWFVGPYIDNWFRTLHLDWLLSGFKVQFYFGGTSLLIVVGVAMDTVQQVESQLIMRHYEGFSKRTRIRGRRG